MSTSGNVQYIEGDTMSTSGDVQYIGRIFLMLVGGYHEYIGVFNIQQRLLSTCSPHTNHDIPPMYLKYPPMYSRYPPMY